MSLAEAHAALLDRKRHLASSGGFTPDWIPDWLYPFQQDLTAWAVEHGRTAVFADCGMGKTPMQLVWAENVRKHTGRPVLVLTPLAVAAQTEAEAHKFGVDAAVSRDGVLTAPIAITNYDRLHYFDPADFGGVVCDESSAIKAFDGQRRADVTEFARQLPYRLLCTATAAPNDYVELGTSSEALGHMGYQDMLSRFFTDKSSTWVKAFGSGYDGYRFKGHAETPFWRWVSSWARALRRPSDLGYSDTGFDLPPLTVVPHVIDAITPREGALFDIAAIGLKEQNQEFKRTVTERCEKAAGLLEDAERGIAWCHRNDESQLLASLIPDAVEVRGSDPMDAKEEHLQAFTVGEIPFLVTKPSIAGFGLNWQNTHRMTYFPSHSYEQYYQAVRRCWRYGQEHSVTVDVVTTTGGLDVLANLQRKAENADRMFTELTAHMRNAMTITIDRSHTLETEIPAWL